MMEPQKETNRRTLARRLWQRPPFCDYGLERMQQLSTASAGAANPFVVGGSGAQLFMRVMATMLRGRIAQDQQAGVTTSTAALACCGGDATV